MPPSPACIRSAIDAVWPRKILRSKMFAELQSHYLFEDRFGRPGKGNDKGKVEGLVGFVRRNFMTPLPVAESVDAFNIRLLDACSKRRQASPPFTILATANLVLS
jgi:transposase